MAVHPPEDVEAKEEPSPEAGSAPKTSRRLLRKRVLIPAVAALTALVLGLAGWLVHANVQLAEAKDAYETSVADLTAARAEAKDAEDALAALLDSLSSDLDIAEQLVELLGAGGEKLLIAAETTRAARELVDELERLSAPAQTAGGLTQSPTVEEYDDLRAKVDELAARFRAHTTALGAQIAAVAKSDTELTAAWQAQAATVPDAVDAALAASSNGSQGTKDAVVAAGEGLTALGDPLDAEAVELWRALQITSSTLASEEKAYQKKKKAAEEEAARQRAGTSSGGFHGGGSQGGGNPGGGYSLKAIEAALAAELGIAASSVTCFDISRTTTRCEYPGGWREYTTTV